VNSDLQTGFSSSAGYDPAMTPAHHLMNNFSPTILRYDSLPSTNTEAARHAQQGAPEGLCVVAGEQTAGRGRLQRHWISPSGAGLYFSILLRPRVEIALWSLIPLLAALAVHDALVEACALETDIKWPNDIMFDERKLCGILAETIETDAGRAVVVGIGINLTLAAFPAELRQAAISLDVAAEEPVDTEGLIQSLSRALAHHYEIFQTTEGPAKVVRDWSQRSSFAEGKRVTVANASETFAGTTRGLESDGGLRVETNQGEIRVVRAGDVTRLRQSET
jgi:BirA family biotin operon repressor/biotin-[acetyl-CoA-carboxylase] ligase